MLYMYCDVLSFSEMKLADLFYFLSSDCSLETIAVISVMETSPISVATNSAIRDEQITITHLVLAYI